MFIPLSPDAPGPPGPPGPPDGPGPPMGPMSPLGPAAREKNVRISTLKLTGFNINESINKTFR